MTPALNTREFKRLTVPKSKYQRLLTKTENVASKEHAVRVYEVASCTLVPMPASRRYVFTPFWGRLRWQETPRKSSCPLLCDCWNYLSLGIPGSDTYTHLHSSLEGVTPTEAAICGYFLISLLVCSSWDCMVVLYTGKCRYVDQASLIHILASHHSASLAEEVMWAPLPPAT